MAYDGSLIFDARIDTKEFIQSVGNLASTATTAGAAVVTAFTAITAAAATASFQVGMSFESAFAGVEKTVNETISVTYADINEEIRDMAKNTMPAAATSIAAVAESAGQLGIATQNITDFSEVMINLGEATNLSSDTAASQLAKFANITQMDTSNYENLGSTIVALGNNFATTEADIVNMSMRLASAGTTAGMAEADILGFATAMSSVGIEAEAGGSAMSTFIKKVQTAVETGKGLEDFAEIAGMTTDAFKQLWSSDAAGAVTAFISNLNNVEEHGRSAIQILDEMGMTDIRLSNTLLALANSGDLMTRSIATSSTAWEENTALMNEVEKRYATTESIMNMTKNNLADVGITVYDKFQVPLVTAFETATDKLQIFNDRIAEGDLSGKFNSMTAAFEQVSAAVIEFVADDVLPAAVDGLAWISDNGADVAAVITTAAVAFGTYKVAVTTSTIAIQACKSATELLMIKTVEWETVLKTVKATASTTMIAVTAAVATVTAVITAYEAKQSKINRIIAEGENVYREQTDAVNKLSEAYRDSVDSAEKIATQHDDEISQLSALKKKLDEQVDANGNIVGSYEMTAEIIQQINELYPTEMEIINGKIEGYNNLSDSVDNYISKLKDEAIYESKKELYKSAVVTYDDASAQYEQLLENQQNATEKYTKWLEEWNYKDKYGVTINPDSLTAAQNEGIGIHEYLEREVNKAYGEYTAANEALNNIKTVIGDSKAVIDNFESYLNERTQSSSTGGIQKSSAQMLAEEQAQKYSYEMQTAAEKLAEQQKENTQKLQEAWEDAEYEYDIGNISSEQELYQKKLEIWSQYGDSSLREHRDYYAELHAYDKDFAEQANQAQEKALSEQEQIVDDGLNEIINQHKEAYDKLERQRQAYRNKLMSVGGSLFSVDVTKDEDGKEITTYTVNNLDEQLKKMQDYHRQVTALKERGASSELLGELTSLGDEESAIFAKQLAGMSAADFAKINDLYNEKQKLADELSQDMYKTEAQSIADSMNLALADLAIGAYDYGAQAAQQFSAGFNSAINEFGVAALYNQTLASGASKVYQNYVVSGESGSKEMKVSVDVTGKSNVYLNGHVIGKFVTDYQQIEQRKTGG